MSDKGRKMRSSFRNTFLSIDMLGEPIGFNIQGWDTFRSTLGSFLVLLIAVVTLAYAGLKIDDLREYSDTTHQTTKGRLSAGTVAHLKKDLLLDDMVILFEFQNFLAEDLQFEIFVN